MKDVKYCKPASEKLQLNIHTDLSAVPAVARKMWSDL